MAICDNSKCAKHVPMPAGWNESERAVRTYERVSNLFSCEVIVQRYPYVNRTGTKWFHLCDACHNAVKMIGE